MTEQNTRPCPQCGQPLALNRHVCPACGYVSPWFKVRFAAGCFFAVLAAAGVGLMVYMALTQGP
ncbi:MAG: hypothetical protein ACLFTT_06395 [Candidatus Hydrogenedentota bacterium]